MVRAARLPRTMRRRAEAKAVLLALADRCDDDGFNAWPAVATIAVEAELSPRTTDKRLAALRDADIIVEQIPPRQHRPRTWRIDLDVLEGLAAAPQEAAGLNDGAGAQHVAGLATSDTHDVAGLGCRSRVIQTRNFDAQTRNSGVPDPQVGSPDPQERSSDPHDRADDPVLLNRPLNGPSLNGPLNEPGADAPEVQAAQARPTSPSPQEQAAAAYQRLTPAALHQLQQDAADSLSGLLSITPHDKKISFIQRQVLLLLEDPRVRQQFTGTAAPVTHG
jgi:hypothetical protein